jgi:hypothetical protein
MWSRETHSNDISNSYTRIQAWNECRFACMHDHETNNITTTKVEDRECFGTHTKFQSLNRYVIGRRTCSFWIEGLDNNFVSSVFLESIENTVFFTTYIAFFDSFSVVQGSHRCFYRFVCKCFSRRSCSRRRVNSITNIVSCDCVFGWSCFPGN